MKIVSKSWEHRRGNIDAPWEPDQIMCAVRTCRGNEPLELERPNTIHIIRCHRHDSDPDPKVATYSLVLIERFGTQMLSDPHSFCMLRLSEA